MIKEVFQQIESLRKANRFTESELQAITRASRFAPIAISGCDPETLTPPGAHVIDGDSAEFLEQLLLRDYAESVHGDDLVSVVRLVQSQAPIGAASPNSCDIDADGGVVALVLYRILDFLHRVVRHGDHDSLLIESVR